VANLLLVLRSLQYRGRMAGAQVCRRYGTNRLVPRRPTPYLLENPLQALGQAVDARQHRMHTVDKASRLENRDYKIGVTLYQLPVPGVHQENGDWKKGTVSRREWHIGLRSPETAPTAFLLECYNPELRTVGLSLTMRSVHEAVKIPSRN